MSNNPPSRPARPSATTIAVDAASLLAGSVWGRMLGAVIGFVTARVLGPADFGVLQIVNFVPSLAKFGSFGFDSVAQREILHLRGGGKAQAQEQTIKDVAFSADFIWATLLLVVIIAFSFSFDQPEVRYGLWIAAASLVAGQIMRLYSVVCTIDKRFTLIAQAAAVGVTVEAIVVLSTVYWGRMYSVLAGSLLGSLIAIAWYRRNASLGFSWDLERVELSRQFRIALPLAGSTLAFGFFGWLERLLVLDLYGSALLGVYMLTVFIYNLGQMFTNNIIRAADAYILERLGDESRTLEDSALFQAPTLALACFFPFFGGLLWLIGPFIIQTLLPEYISAVPLLPWIGIMLTIRGVSAIPLKTMYSSRLNQQNAYMGLWILTSGIFATAILIGHLAGADVTIAAIAKTLAFTTLATAGFIRTRAFFFSSIPALLAFAIKVSAPLLASSIFIIVTNQMFPGGSIGVLLLRCFLFCTLYLLLVVLLDRRMGFLGKLGRPLHRMIIRR